MIHINKNNFYAVLLFNRLCYDIFIKFIFIFYYYIKDIMLPNPK